MITSKKEDIIKLGLEGKSYTEIQKITGASKGTISYHLGKGQKEKSGIRRKNRGERIGPLARRLEGFKYCIDKIKFIPPINREIRSEGGWIKRIFTFKISRFQTTKENLNRKRYMSHTQLTFTAKDVMEKSGGICYLSGRPLDFSKGRTFELDHIIPKSLGGSNELDNCGATCRDANQAKAHMTKEEFFQLCIDVVKHNNLVVI